MLVLLAIRSSINIQDNVWVDLVFDAWIEKSIEIIWYKAIDESTVLILKQKHNFKGYLFKKMTIQALFLAIAIKTMIVKKFK